MKKLRILLVRPRPPKETIGLQHVMICEPLELEYLAGNLDPGRYTVRIYDGILEKKPLGHYLRRWKPHLVGMTGYITHVGIIRNMARKIKAFSPQITTVVGGVHAEVMPQDFYSGSIDYIICSDPIGTFQRIAALSHGALLEKKEQEGAAASGVEGTYQKGISHRRSAVFPYGIPDREAVLPYRHRYYYMFHRPCALMKTSFGCPFTCSFCFCKEVTGGRYYARPIAEVADELEGIREKEVYIVDDDFLFDAGRLHAFCDLLEKRRIRKHFLVYGRADFIAGHPDLIKRLAKNGLRAVIVGIESVREKDLLRFNKRNTLENNRKAVGILQENGIELYATMILQMDFTRKDFRDIEAYIKELGIVFVNLQPLTPLPGTEIYQEYKKDILVKRGDFAKWDLAHVVLRPKHMSIRAYYYEIIRLYSAILFRRESIVKMISRYGWWEVLRMWWGSQHVSWQYIGKMIRGQ